MVEVSLTVGNLDASLALLLTNDHRLIEFPTILLPDGISKGSVVKISCERNLKREEEISKQFSSLQDEIYDTFGKHEPSQPVLKIVNVTQTSCVLMWDELDLGNADLKSLTLFKNGIKLSQMRSPLTKRTIKLSGLSIDTPYKFQLKMDTSAGTYRSDILEIKTHMMTDLTGISICIGSIDFSREKDFTLTDIEDCIKKIGARPLSDTVQIETTQFICTSSDGMECSKAKSMNIPVVRPEWLKACELERRIVGVNKFYLDAENPIWEQKNFWLTNPMENKETITKNESSNQEENVQDNSELVQENTPEPSVKPKLQVEGEDVVDSSSKKIDKELPVAPLKNEEQVEDIGQEKSEEEAIKVEKKDDKNKREEEKESGKHKISASSNRPDDIAPISHEEQPKNQSTEESNELGNSKEPAISKEPVASEKATHIEESEESSGTKEPEKGTAPEEAKKLEKTLKIELSQESGKPLKEKLDKSVSGESTAKEHGGDIKESTRKSEITDDKRDSEKVVEKSEGSKSPKDSSQGATSNGNKKRGNKHQKRKKKKGSKGRRH